MTELQQSMPKARKLGQHHTQAKSLQQDLQVVADKLLICGDSFAADWTVKYPVRGWPNMLAEQYQVTNLAQAGCGEYKIHQQLQSADLGSYDYIIVSHTSPYRLHTQFHPIHYQDVLHKNCDFLYEDVRAHKLKSVTEHFERYFDLEQAKFVQTLICERIDQETRTFPVLHIAHIDWTDLYAFPGMINFGALHQKHSGNANHYNETGNELVYNTLVDHINKS